MVAERLGNQAIDSTAEEADTTEASCELAWGPATPAPPCASDEIVLTLRGSRTMRPMRAKLIRRSRWDAWRDAPPLGISTDPWISGLPMWPVFQDSGLGR